MLSKAFVVAVLLPMLVLMALGFGLSTGMRRLHARVQASSSYADGPQPVRAVTVARPMAQQAQGADHPTAQTAQSGSDAGALDGHGTPARASNFTSRGRRLYDPMGRRWRPRGGELMAAASCGEDDARPSLPELLAEADRLLATGINLVRIPLEPWQNAGFWSHPDDVAELRTLVQHVVQHPHTAAMLSAAVPMGTSAGADDLPRQLVFWREVVEIFAHQPQVIFDLSLSQVGGDMQIDDDALAFNTDALVREIRATERAFGAPMHLVAVQGSSPTKNSRGRDYYQGQKLAAAKGGNVVWVGHRPSYVMRRPGSLYLTPVR